MVALFLFDYREPVGTISYAGVVLALGFGVSAILGRPRVLHRDRVAGVLMDAAAVSLLVAGTGGEDSRFFPLYLLASLGLVRTPGGVRVAVGAAGLVGGYLVSVVFSTQEPGASSWAAVALGVGFVVLSCGVAAFVGERLRAAEEENRRVRSDLGAERTYGREISTVVSRFDSVLAFSSPEKAMRWAVETAREALGVSYAHAVALDGYRHRTAAADGDIYPSWWHPEIQRLVLWSSRSREVVRSDEVIHGIEGFVALPVIPADDGDALGAIVVGGKKLDAEDERVLESLAVPVASVLGDAGEAPGGRDPVSELPNGASLHRVLREELSRGRPLTVLAVDLGGFGRYNDIYGFAAGDRLLWETGQRFKEAKQQVFRYGGDVFVLLLRGAGEEKARAGATKVRRMVEEATAGSATSLTAAVGYATVRPDRKGAGSPLLAALDALDVAKRRPDGVAGDPPGRTDTREQAVRGARSLRTPEAARILERAIEVCDPQLADHSRAVARLTGSIGSEMALTSEQLEASTVGALLHDVGKLGLPDSILHKPGPLDAEEREIMKLHPVLGARIVGDIAELSPALPAVLHHHERFDGGGYPDGLRGGEIPLVARVVFVADTFDSMTQNRSYRRGCPEDEALAEIRANSGTQFDPEVVAALMRASEGSELRRASS